MVRLRETSVHVGGNAETSDYSMVLIEADEASESFRNAPSAGVIKAPSIKCSFIRQSEALSAGHAAEPAEKAPAEGTSPQTPGEGESANPEESAAAVPGTDVGPEEGKASEEQAGASLETEKSEDRSGTPADSAKHAPELAAEPFDDSREDGSTTHVFLKNAVKGKFTEESIERVQRTSCHLVKAIEQLLNLTRPISFSS